MAMMRNEVDTAGPVIEHLFEQGVDQVLVADNGSTDGTREVLTALADRYPMHIVEDHLEAHLQGAKMTVLVAKAREAGADWIVPFDADELWFAAGQTVADFLRACPADIVRASIHDVFPSADDDPNEPNPFLRLHRFDTEPFPIHKVAFRTSRLLKVAEGNMDVTRRGQRTDGLFIAHYPWRTYEQLARKVRHGRLALEQTNLSEDMGIHWRVAGGWTDDQLRAAWDDLVAGRTVEDLSWSPVGRLETRIPGSWTTWQHAPHAATPR
jgi:glycosyltransferase involved in cell wall biosynthesis